MMLYDSNTVFGDETFKSCPGEKSMLSMSVVEKQL
jgi:hypothetical protein